ncbi:MAG TPA: hypothetical protein VEH04_17010 [Verrucomicrobiae bacterium]|nr:hypothetical protein [Verrucomicrobiae bacterium]
MAVQLFAQLRIIGLFDALTSDETLFPVGGDYVVQISNPRRATHALLGQVARVRDDLQRVWRWPEPGYFERVHKRARSVRHC